MLKITAIGNLTNDVELKMNETTGKPYAILVGEEFSCLEFDMNRDTIS